VPISHPFVERLIGAIRREYLDRTLFWTTGDLEMKLLDFQRYYTVTERMQGWTGARRTRARTWAANARMSVRIDGSCTVVGCIRHRWRRDLWTTAVGNSEPRAVSTVELHPVLSAWVNLCGDTDSGRITGTRVLSGLFATQSGIRHLQVRNLPHRHRD
jgi:hypothetical protein